MIYQIISARVFRRQNGILEIKQKCIIYMRPLSWLAERPSNLLINSYKKKVNTSSASTLF